VIDIPGNVIEFKNLIESVSCANSRLEDLTNNDHRVFLVVF
jgi:transcriptional regulator with AAA-type ATPase domain